MPPYGVLLTVAYDGAAFSGWAAQKDAGTRTVEQVLGGAIRAVDPRAEGPRGTSRTDAGVHARGQLAAVDASLDIPPRGWVLAVNQHLPEDVAVRAARSVPAGFQPRFASRGKRYRYEIVLDVVRDPLLFNRAWRIGYDMDMTLLGREAKTIVGTHDFAAFRAAADARVSTTRTVTRVDVERAGDRVAIVVEGTAFLYNMVRILVGSLVDVARGQLPEGAIARALAGGARGLAGQTAPAHGLYLEHVDVELPAEAGEPWPR
jgi:tRNA pseudouridine38-40 synthase